MLSYSDARNAPEQKSTFGIQQLKPEVWSLESGCRLEPVVTMQTAALAEAIERDGCCVIPGVYPPDAVGDLVTAMDSAFRAAADADPADLRHQGVIQDRRGAVYGARNVLSLFPEARTLWRVPVLMDLLTAVLGTNCGLVRALFFDKSPERTWALPWHKDMTIAVADSDLPTSYFFNPTRKAGVCHVEAPAELLHSMLTLRIHLDDMTEDNGPLRVIRGSHRESDCEPTMAAGEQSTILLHRGDVFAMRPLLTHSSLAGQTNLSRHRRTLHLEFSAVPELPDGFRWHTWEPVVLQATGSRPQAPG